MGLIATASIVIVKTSFFFYKTPEKLNKFEINNDECVFFLFVVFF